jgi:cell fate regulator YaaT (PSP1 superfamily)
VSGERPPPERRGEAPPARAARGEETRNLVGVRLTPHGRTLELDAGELRLLAGERVVLDDRRAGTAVATVTIPSAHRPARGPVGRVLRRAQPGDLERLGAEQARGAEALAFARERARARALPIKFFRVEAAPGGDKTTFYFSSEQRVDFRELVRDLAARFHARIELRQVGVRDEAKMVGGIGSCGRELCCSTFLPQFAPVTIKMAKNQNLALNPSRVSGQCGRLKCCLVYEEAQYVEAGKLLPRIGKRVETPDGLGRVDDLDVLGGRVRVSFMDRPPAVYAAAEVRRPKDADPPTDPEREPGPAGDGEPPPEAS